MKIVLIDNCGFLMLTKTTMICLGSREEVENADEFRIRDMIKAAVVHNAYNGIETSKGRTLH